MHTWKTSLSTAGLSPATVNAKLAAVNGFLRFLGRPECCVRQVRRQRRVFRDKGRDLSHSEYLRLVQAAKRQGRERLCLVLQTICATGIRVSELRFITGEAVRTGRATVTGKGKCREILLPGKLRAPGQRACVSDRRRAAAGPLEPLAGDAFTLRRGQGRSAQGVPA